ncbi:hypothetical protein IQ06DRAFT_94348 [Phaeosphaeriaceae sp. SRC1lsM3a]|nr:hypothetical protein IQ06DRAFT_94348 [Stagonospora sp. SRC1lsM3a]
MIYTSSKITGRIKDLIIRGGEDICPVENESVLWGHPAVKQVVVSGGKESAAVLEVSDTQQGRRHQVENFLSRSGSLYQVHFGIWNRGAVIDRWNKSTRVETSMGWKGCFQISANRTARQAPPRAKTQTRHEGRPSRDARVDVSRGGRQDLIDRLLACL